MDKPVCNIILLYLRFIASNQIYKIIFNFCARQCRGQNSVVMCFITCLQHKRRVGVHENVYEFVCVPGNGVDKTVL